MMTKRFVPRFLLTLILTAGACGVCIIIGGSLKDALPETGERSAFGESIFVADDGTVLIASPDEDSGFSEHRDLEGNLVVPSPETHALRLGSRSIYQRKSAQSASSAVRSSGLPVIFFSSIPENSKDFE